MVSKYFNLIYIDIINNIILIQSKAFINFSSILYFNKHLKLIMNSWNIIHEGSKYISENIEPIYISYNLFSQNNIPSNYIENIKKYQPIGCRDLRTKHNFRKNNIDSYFSSCLTTTLDIDYAAPEQERTEEIIFIDYEFGDYPEADEYLLSLKSYNSFLI